MTKDSSEGKHQSPETSGAAMDRPLEKSKTPFWRMRAVIAAAAVTIVSALAWQALPVAGSTNVDREDIQIGEVESAEFEDYLPIRAEVAPAVSTLVGVLSGGQVKDLYVQDGAFVEKGQPLAQLDNSELRLRILSEEAQIASQLGGVAGENLGIARSALDRAGQVSQAEYDLIRARRDLEVRQELHKRGFVSDAGVASYKEEADFRAKRLAQLRDGNRAESQITATQRSLLAATRERLQSNLEAVRAGLDTLTIRAPLTGRLTNFNLQPGQSLSVGDPAGQVDSEGEWKLEGEVDEFYLDKVKVGQKGQTGSGIPVVVSKVLPTVTDGRFKIELTFERRPDQPFNRGQTQDVRITLGAASRAITAPVGAWLSDGGNSVFVVDDSGGRARRRQIEIGRRNPRQVEVLSGLEAGDRIVTSDLSTIEGDVINLR